MGINDFREKIIVSWGKKLLPGVKPLCEVIFSLVSLKPASTVFFFFFAPKNHSNILYGVKKR
jgi:hypothetical protein